MKNLIIFVVLFAVNITWAVAFEMEVRCFDNTIDRCSENIRIEMKRQYCHLESDIFCGSRDHVNGHYSCKFYTHGCETVRDDGNGTRCENGGEKVKFLNSKLTSNFIGKMMSGSIRYTVKHFCKYYTF